MNTWKEEGGVEGKVVAVEALKEVELEVAEAAAVAAAR